MKHIAVNTRLLKNPLDGIGRFSFEVLTRLTTQHPETTFTFIYDRKQAKPLIEGHNVRHVVIPIPSRHAVLWYAGFHVALPLYLSHIQPDIFFSPESYITTHPSIPQVAVFHDIDFELRPQDIGSGTALWYLKRFFPEYARRAAHIVAVSDYTKQNLMQMYHIPEHKISVSYNAAMQNFHPTSLAAQQAIRAKFTDGQPFFHFVGTIQPRKNIEGLLMAFDAYKQLTGLPTRLLIVGKQGWKTENAARTFENMQYKSDVHFTGFVDDATLNAIYGASIALCMVSFLEGFGIPAVEAMKCETAVIATCEGALPEVCGEAAHFIYPQEVDSITQALIRLSKDPQYRTSLIEKGKSIRNRYNWDTTAAQIWTQFTRLK